MPQLTQFASTYASQIFWLLVVFGLIYFVIGRGMVPKIEGTVEAREAGIAADLAEARRARADAQALEVQWRANLEKVRAEAQAGLAKAKAKAAAAAEARLSATDADLTRTFAEAEARLEAAKAKALHGLEAAAADAARDITLRLAGLKVAPGDATVVVQRALSDKDGAQKPTLKKDGPHV